MILQARHAGGSTFSQGIFNQGQAQVSTTAGGFFTVTSPRNVTKFFAWLLLCSVNAISIF